MTVTAPRGDGHLAGVLPSTVPAAALCSAHETNGRRRMPTTLTSLKVFIASPGGLAEERKAFRDAVQELNDADAVARGVFFQPVGWEDTLGGIGRPQTLINEDVRAADYFVLLLWNRWGSPSDTAPSKFSSGTEEEYHVAM